MNQHVDALVRSAVILIAIVAFAYLINTVSKQYLVNRAVDGCIMASQTEIVNTDASSWKGPNDAWYVRCMQEKGIDK